MARGGSWLVLKAAVLLLPLMGVLKEKGYTYQWSSMFILAFFAEGVMRAWGDNQLSQRLAMLEVVLTVAYFTSVVLYVRAKRLQLAA